jgi:hypothetical protein
MGGNSTNFKSIVLVETFEHEAQEKNSFQVNKYCSCQVLLVVSFYPRHQVDLY